MAMTEGSAPAPTDPISIDQVNQIIESELEAERSPAEPESEPEPAPQPVAAAPEPVKEEPQHQGDLRVPLREERERRRQAEANLAQMNETMRNLAAMQAKLAGQISPPAPDAPKAPDFESDPAGFLKHSIDQLQRQIADVGKQQTEQAEQAKQVEAFNQATRAVTDLERAFVQATPDYYEAVDFMRAKMKARAEVLGVPKEQAELVVKQDLQRFGLQSLQAGVNPAERLFALAKVEGYAGPKESAAAKLETIAKGQQTDKARRSSAPASDGALTLEEAARLPIKAFAKMSEDDFRRLAGG